MGSSQHEQNLVSAGIIKNGLKEGNIIKNVKWRDEDKLTSVMNYNVEDPPIKLSNGNRNDASNITNINKLNYDEFDFLKIKVEWEDETSFQINTTK
jgi:hypothetical protein